MWASLRSDPDVVGSAFLDVVGVDRVELQPGNSEVAAGKGQQYIARGFHLTGEPGYSTGKDVGDITAGTELSIDSPGSCDRDEHVCLEMRRHGVVLARPLSRSGGVAIAGIFILTLPWAAAAGIGAALIAVAAAFTLRAVWQWERTRIVVTTEKLYVINGTLRRRTKAVKLRAVDAVELDQSLLGQLLGYGTVVVGPLTVGHVAGPKEVCQLVEELAS